MANLSSFHPFEFLRRMGVKDQGETRLELIEAMQPTIEVANAALLFPPVLPPTAIGGGFRTPAVGNKALVRVAPGAGGCHIRAIGVHTTTAGNPTWAWHVVPVAAAVALVSSTAIAFQQLSQRGDLVCTALIADILNANEIPIATNPNQRPTAQVQPTIPEIYVPGGFVFEVSETLTVANIHVSLLVQDAFGPEPLA